MTDYSAHVELRLVLDSDVLSLAQLGPSFAILREAVMIEPTNARIEIVVDQRVSAVYDVFLQDGISSTRFEFRDCI